MREFNYEFDEYPPIPNKCKYCEHHTVEGYWVDEEWICEGCKQLLSDQEEEKSNGH